LPLQLRGCHRQCQVPDMEDTPIFAFVLMPFDSRFDDLYRFGIKEPAEHLGIVAEQVDEQIYTESILERIYRQIDLADIIIADMSGQNPNVFYEVGYAHAKSKLCILLTENVSDIPFDLKHRRHIVHNASIHKLKNAITDELKWATREIENLRISRIKIHLAETWGLLEKTSYSAEGNLEFKIDMSNDSNRPSAEIEALYFYSSKGWELKQGQQECPSTDSDVAGFARRHFLTPPIRRLQAKAWAQIRFRATKVLAWAIKGEELKNSYQVHGRAILRLVTSEGNFDHELNIDTEVDEIPF
jgi:hypothetical protein